MNRNGKQPDPQGLKPALLLAPGGTAEAVPFPTPFMRWLLVFGPALRHLHPRSPAWERWRELSRQFQSQLRGTFT